VKTDHTIYDVHVAFWVAFLLARVVAGFVEGKRAAPAPEVAPVSREEKTAPLSRALVVLHMLAFPVMYSGMEAVVFRHRAVWLHGQPWLGSAIIVLGAALTSWTLFHFRSWRLRAKLDAGHRLATGGPFRIVRHPIYTGLNLLALGTAVWMPTAQLWIAFGLMAVGGDLRARAEEKVLTEVFGAAYRDYCARVSRFLPGIY